VCWQDVHSLLRGNAGEIQEGTSWLIFFRPFFVQRQRKGNLVIRERAKQCERQKEKSLKIQLSQRFSRQIP